MRGFCVFAGGLLAVLLALPALAERDLDALRERNERYEKQQLEEQQAKARWQNELRGLLAERDAARSRLTQAEASYKRLRSRNRARGAKRANALTAVEQARADLANAEEKLEAFYKGARRAGIPRGWLRLRDRDS